MYTSVEKKRRTQIKTLAIMLTILFHLAVFGGLYYALETGDKAPKEMSIVGP
jgi:hypothetical protein